MRDTLIQLGMVLFAAVLLAAGGFLSWAFQRSLARRKRWLREGVVVTGRVVALDEDRFKDEIGEARSKPVPVVTFTTPGGNVRTFTSSAAMGVEYTVGQEVAVRYLPSDPKSAELDSVARGRLVPIALLVLAAMCFAGAASEIVFLLVLKE
jgi:hypothetical protein